MTESLIIEVKQPPPILRTSGLTRRYGAVTVLDHVDFELRRGEIHALLGANGAGKSTLCKIISGLLSPSDGSMSIRDNDFCPANKKEAERCGVEIVQQELNLISTLSVAENLQFTRLPSVAGVIRGAQMRRQAREILDRYGMREVPVDTKVGNLGVGRQQMVEIASALARECEILILDEPTAALSGSESERLFEWLNELREQGVGIIYISHRLDEVSRLADRITVLRDGKLVCTRGAANVSTDEMIDLMSGEPDHAIHAAERQSFRTEEVAMRVRGISCGPVRDVSFDVHNGERLGIAGLVGSGRTELLRAIFGADAPSAGSVRVGAQGEPQTFRSPRQAVASGLAMVTEDRKQNGLLLSQSIRINTTLGSLRERFSKAGLVQGRLERDVTRQQCESLETRCTSIEQITATLSGGNQQKVAVAKWLVRDADVFLFDEPTRGIDAAARRRIYQLFESLAADGKAIVIVSSDLDELMETCDRIAVMSAGRLTDTFSRDSWSEDRIMQAAFSGYAASLAGQE